MKFGAALRDSAAELPDTEDLFLKYKQLKKSLKRMHPAADTEGDRVSHPSEDEDSANDDLSSDMPSAAAQQGAKRAKQALSVQPQRSPTGDAAAAAAAHENADGSSGKAGDAAAGGGENNSAGGGSGCNAAALDAELEVEFLRVITADVMELNERYIEKEEDNVIKFGGLEEEAENARSAASKAAAYRAFVDFHGELLMLFHWSVLAYTGLVKILKKHRKRTGARLHAPHLENLLTQPFCSVEVTCEMLRKAEAWVAKLAAEVEVVPPPPVPLPEVLARGSETTTSPQEKAGVLEAVAAALKAAEGQAAGEAAQQAGAKQERGTETDAAAPGSSAAGIVAAAVGGVGGVGAVPPSKVCAQTQATRRIRAALNLWQQLQTNASTPSTVIAAAAVAAAAGGGAGADAAKLAPSNLTNSSYA